MHVALQIDELAMVPLPLVEMDQVKAKMNITPFVTRQKVNGWLVDKVGTGLFSGTPTLAVADNRLCWRVPVLLALPSLGLLGTAGTVAVDVQNGEFLTSEQLSEELTDYASQLVARSTRHCRVIL